MICACLVAVGVLCPLVGSALVLHVCVEFDVILSVLFAVLLICCWFAFELILFECDCAIASASCCRFDV